MFGKLALLLAALVSLSGCATTTFHDAECQSADCQRKNVGLYYYQPVPHLLVTRPQNKDGETATSIVYLPDTSRPMSMKFHPGIGKGVMAVSLTNGMIASFNQETDPKLPELLANLAAPVTGLATAEATRATAGLTDVQADQLSTAAFDAAGSDAKLKSSLLRMSASSCAPPMSPSATNPALSPQQIADILAGVERFACAAVILKSAGDGPSSRALAETTVRLYGLTTKDFSDSSGTSVVRAIYDGNLEAAALRKFMTPYKAYDLGEGDEQKKAAGFVKVAAAQLLDLADHLDPPKPKPPVTPFELYRIDMTNGILTRVQ